jgi:hypothetical protein
LERDALKMKEVLVNLGYKFEWNLSCFRLW